jgi:cytochrome P450
VTHPDNFLASAVWDDPYPYFARLRQDDPVSWNSWWKGWVITRYDDVDFLLRRSADVSAATVAPARARATPEQLKLREASFRLLGSFLPLNDPPDHTRLRRLVNKAFTPGTVARLEPGIAVKARELLDAVAGQEQFDVVRDFSHPLTLTVIAEMLGIPEPDRGEVGGWGQQLVLLVLEGRDTGGRQDLAEQVLRQMEQYFRELLRQRRRDPRDDLISALGRAEHEGGLLTEDEVVATCILLIFAGQETTTGLIANAVLALDAHPDQRDLLVARPDLMPGAIEELLRYCGTVFAITRMAKAPFALRGKEIAAGDKLLLVLAAADRDPERFPDPDRLDLTRNAQGHLAFAGGVHYCLGGPLARVEARIGLGELLTRYPRMSPAPQELDWGGVIITREPASLLVRARPGDPRNAA